MLIQARVSSTRLPGKVLAPILGRPLLEYMTESVSHCTQPNQLAIITSTDRSDDPIDLFCKDRSIDCFRGDLEDVAQRFLCAALHFSLENVVRVSGDSPLLDYRLVDKALSIKARGDVDLVTNVVGRTFPPGQSVEVFSRTLLEDNIAKFDKTEREHVTAYFYKARGTSISNFELHPPAGDLHLAVDRPEDLRRISSLIQGLERPHWDYTVEDLVTKARRLA